MSIRYTERLTDAWIEPSVGSTGNSYDNALAESVIGLFKTEVIRRRGPWRGIEDVEFATLTWVAWYKTTRLLERLGYGPPAEFEESFHRRQQATAEWRHSRNELSGELGAVQGGRSENSSPAVGQDDGRRRGRCFARVDLAISSARPS